MFTNSYIKKTLKQCKNHAKTPSFSALKRQNLDCVALLAIIFVLLGKIWKYGKEILGMGTYFAPSSLFTQA